MDNKIEVGDAKSNIINLCNSYDDSLKRQDMFNGYFRLGSVVSDINN